MRKTIIVVFNVKRICTLADFELIAILFTETNRKIVENRKIIKVEEKRVNFPKNSFLNMYYHRFAIRHLLSSIKIEKYPFKNQHFL